MECWCVKLTPSCVSPLSPTILQLPWAAQSLLEFRPWTLNPMVCTLVPSRVGCTLLLRSFPGSLDTSPPSGFPPTSPSAPSQAPSPVNPHLPNCSFWRPRALSFSNLSTPSGWPHLVSRLQCIYMLTDIQINISTPVLSPDSTPIHPTA